MNSTGEVPMAANISFNTGGSGSYQAGRPVAESDKLSMRLKVRNLYRLKRERTLVCPSTNNTILQIEEVIPAILKWYEINPAFERVPGSSVIRWPYRPDSYLLISAGPNGLYGDDDDICNF